MCYFPNIAKMLVLDKILRFYGRTGEKKSTSKTEGKHHGQRRTTSVYFSRFIVSLNYISLPGFSDDPKDITFPASLLTGALASFGLEGAKKRGDGTFKPEDKPLNKKEVQALLASQSGGYQTIRIETPIKIIGAEIVDHPSPKK